MTPTLTLVLQVVALVFFVLAAGKTPESRVSFGWTGAAFAWLSLLVR